MSLDKLAEKLKGGKGSGDHGHSGRPGKRGGSAGGSAGGFSSVRGILSERNLRSLEEYSNTYIQPINDPFDKAEVADKMRIQGWKTSGKVRGGWVASQSVEQDGHKLFIAHSGATLQVTLDGEDMQFKNIGIPQKSTLTNLIFRGVLPN